MARKVEEGNWYKREPRKFLRGVRGMGPEAIGAYVVIVDLILEGESPRPSDLRWLSGWLGCSTRKATLLVASLLATGALGLSVKGCFTVDPEAAGSFSQPPRKTVPQWLRILVLERDGEVCRYCHSEAGPFEIDHILAVVRGGLTVLANLCVACLKCNRSKGAKLLEEWCP